MKLSDFGEPVIPGAEIGTWIYGQLHMVAPHDNVPYPHWHDREIERYRGQLVECRRCGFWLPPGRRCPMCEAAEAALN